MITWTPLVNKINDGDAVEAAVINGPLQQLVARDEYLYDLLAAGNARGSLIAVNIPIANSAVSPNPSVAVVNYSVVSFDSTDTVRQGLVRSAVGFTNNNQDQLFRPESKSFVFGVVKSISGTVADVYLRGLIKLNAGETFQEKFIVSNEIFEAGPYYLSKAEPGRLTSKPGGIALYVGYAMNQSTFLLNPQADTFNQLFINYRFELLGEELGQSVGWKSVQNNQIGKPEGATHYYEIPVSNAAILASTMTAPFGGQLDLARKDETILLKTVLPLFPASFTYTFATQNGVILKQRIAVNDTGHYAVNAHGIWWYGVAANIGPGIEPITLQISKLNPDLQFSAVTSLEPDNEDGSDKVLTLINPLSKAIKSVGDLQINFNLIILDEALQLSSELKVISALRYDLGNLKIQKTPVISKIESSTIGVETNLVTGVCTLTDASQGGLSGTISSLEPENARLEYLGLNSYLALPNPSIGYVSGFIGKFHIPRTTSSLNGLTLKLVVSYIGSTSSAATNVPFSCSYAVSKLEDILTDVSIAVPITLSSSLSLSGAVANASYVAKTLKKKTIFTIPGTQLASNAIVNFRLQRTGGSTIADSYTGELGVVDVYWTFGLE